MSALSAEVNRLLGTALLDPDWCCRLLGEDRSQLIQGFALTQAEYVTIQKSSATSLHELVKDITEELNGAPTQLSLSVLSELYQADWLGEAQSLESTPWPVSWIAVKNATRREAAVARSE